MTMYKGIKFVVVVVESATKLLTGFLEFKKKECYLFMLVPYLTFPFRKDIGKNISFTGIWDIHYAR